MTAQYLRKATLLVTQQNGQGIDMSELHFKFMVKRGDIQTPNSLDVRVYNVAPDTMQRITSAKPETEFTRIILQVGYGDNVGVLFDGTIKQARRGRENQTDTYLDLTAADGDYAYNYSIINTTLAAGSTMNDHVNAVLNSMSPAPSNITKGYMPPLPTQALPRGKVMYGQSRDTMRQVAASNRMNWSIQNGQLQLVPFNSYILDEAILLNSESGMIGLPELTQNGIRIRALINPKFQAGKTVQIDEKSVQRLRFGLGLSAQAQQGFVPVVPIDGLYRVLYAEHIGDTRGNDWYSDLICLSVNAALPPSDIGKSAVAPAGAVRPFG